MELTELRRWVGSILETEEAEPTNWDSVCQETENLWTRLAAEPDTVVPQLVDEYLNDPDIRQRDAVYARRQRDGVRHFVETGEYVDSTPIPRWACLFTLALVVGLIVWIAR